MGKKVNSKKHRGIRDPLRQLEVKHRKIKNKINDPPKNPDDQEAPKKCKIILSHRDTKEKSLSQRKARKDMDAGLMDTARFVSQDIGIYPKNGRPFKPIPTLVQNPGETEYQFFKRVSRATEMVKHEAQFQDKYNVEVQRDEAGYVTGFKSGSEIEAEGNSRHHEKQSQTRNEKRKLKRKERELKKKLKKMKKRKRGSDNDDDSDFENNSKRKENYRTLQTTLFNKEEIKFGEVVHAPPNLHSEEIEKELAQQKNMRIKNFLFLQTLQNQNKSNEQLKLEPSESKARKMLLEEERKKAVFAYRQLKANRRSAVT